MFISKRFAQKAGVAWNELTEGSAARLPNGTLIPMEYETEPVTLCVDKHYKADLRFRTLPLETYDLILGSPWMADNAAVIDFSDKSVAFDHRGRKMKVFPANPLNPADLSFEWTQPPSQLSEMDVPECAERKVRFNPSSGPRKQLPKPLKTILAEAKQQIRAQRDQIKERLMEKVRMDPMRVPPLPARDTPTLA